MNLIEKLSELADGEKSYARVADELICNACVKLGDNPNNQDKLLLAIALLLYSIEQNIREQ